MFTTVRDDQDAVRILVMQGESDDAHHNVLLGDFRLEGLPPGPKGGVEVEVTFSIGEDGILGVSARDAASGLGRSIAVKGHGGIPATQLVALQAEAEAHLVKRRTSS